METTKPSVFKPAMPFGLILAAASILFSLLLYAFDAMTNQGLAYLGYIIMIVVIVLAVKSFREKHGNGFVSFGQGFQTGFYIVIISSVISAIYTYLFFAFFDPEMITKMIEMAEEKMLESNPDMPQEQLDMAMKWTKKFMSPVWMAIWGTIWNIIIGSILSLIIAAIMKKEDKSFNTIM